MKIYVDRNQYSQFLIPPCPRSLLNTLGRAFTTFYWTKKTSERKS